MKALDLFCGLGGWSDGLTLEGFEVLGVEINQEIADLYKHPVICEDVRNLNPKDFIGYDLIVGSPPCRDFSRLGRLFGHNWKRPPDPEGEGMSLVNAFLRIVEEAEPHYWLLENVPDLEKYLKIPPRTTAKIGESMRRSFWGNFPSFLIPRDYNKKTFTKRKYLSGDHEGKNSPVCLDGSKLAKWNRARIPLPVARSLGKCVGAAIRGSGTLVAPLMSQIATDSDGLDEPVSHNTNKADPDD